ncbi:putative GNAT superfamily acetyltransferase [Pullulanibacillus pueri]|uniref:N-acetyltransferase domain-containing protein n=1 Tax=Pullulanibacillus pueri TaxID=1437324 RepID=A0A8J2ZVM8_9BACL|nr:GNAT family N-acetyltransferase [Pullulanibacillus pueri]MBM7682397.1 putative GNAT superfamily acetyltransferase [Pullulanibacillus pueri]GGH81797.1 hypothetical protein GCM10007096_20230 [Pullulanibacillus pueri]
MSNAVIRKLSTVAELEEMQKLEEEVWHTAPIPIHQTLTAAKNGGIVLGAYERDHLVGFLYSFAGFKDGNSYLCSHMLGIKRDFQKQKMGERLKQRQYELAREAGYSSIVWTFDPLLSLNAYLNLHKLGAFASQYIENSYGEMTDALNAGLPTDRFLAEWPIASKRSSGLGDRVTFATGQLTKPNDAHASRETQIDEAHCLLKVVINKQGLPVPETSFLQDVDIATSPEWFVPVPYDFQTIRSLDHELAMNWRIATREVFNSLIAQGFVGVDLIKKSDAVSYYRFVLKKLTSLREDE